MVVQPIGTKVVNPGDMVYVARSSERDPTEAYTEMGRTLWRSNFQIRRGLVNNWPAVSCWQCPPFANVLVVPPSCMENRQVEGVSYADSTSAMEAQLVFAANKRTDTVNIHLWQSWALAGNVETQVTDW